MDEMTIGKPPLLFVLYMVHAFAETSRTGKEKELEFLEDRLTLCAELHAVLDDSNLEPRSLGYVIEMLDKHGK